jgi:hypothetical protein
MISDLKQQYENNYNSLKFKKQIMPAEVLQKNQAKKM